MTSLVPRLDRAAPGTEFGPLAPTDLSGAALQLSWLNESRDFFSLAVALDAFVHKQSMDQPFLNPVPDDALKTVTDLAVGCEDRACRESAAVALARYGSRGADALIAEVVGSDALRSERAMEALHRLTDSGFPCLTEGLVERRDEIRDALALAATDERRAGLGAVILANLSQPAGTRVLPFNS